MKEIEPTGPRSPMTAPKMVALAVGLVVVGVILFDVMTWVTSIIFTIFKFAVLAGAIFFVGRFFLRSRR